MSLSKRAMHRIIKRAGAEKVTESASTALANYLEKIGIDLASEALSYANHAGRKTLKSKDIKIVAEKRRLI